MMKKISWRQAAVSGLIFAVLTCAWTYFRHSPDFDELAIRFAFSFTVFTVGYRYLMNLIARREGRGR